MVRNTSDTAQENPALRERTSCLPGYGSYINMLPKGILYHREETPGQVLVDQLMASICSRAGVRLERKNTPAILGN